jgi:hypothetical protein
LEPRENAPPGSTEPEKVGVAGGPPYGIPPKVNITQQTNFPSPVTVKETPLPALQRHGVWLAWGVMGIILLFGLLLIGLVGAHEFMAPPKEVETVLVLIEKTAATYAQAASGPEALKQMT